MIGRNVRRTVALLLTCAMIISLLPLFGSSVYADDEETVDEIKELSKEDFEKEKKKAEAELDKKMGVIDEEPAPESEPEEEAKEFTEAELQKEPLTVEIASGNDIKLNGAKQGDLKLNNAKRGDLKLDGYDEETQQTVYVSAPDSSGNVTIIGADISGTSYHYSAIYIGDEEGTDDEQWYKFELTSGNDPYYFAKQYNMKNLHVGYHTLYVEYTDGTDPYYLTVKKVPTYIYKSVSNSLSNYYTYIDSFTSKYSDSTYYDVGGPGEYLNMFIDYKKKGSKNYSNVYLMEYANSAYKKKGLKPNTTYYVRQMLGKTFNYDGITYTFTGRLTGYASSAKTIKTAYKKPKVKSIKITKGKLKVQRWKVLYAYRYRYRVNRRTGYRRLISVTPLYHRYKKYYTKFKVTVRFKKKQGVAGVYIGTLHGLYAYKKGNKKKYSQTFTCTGKKKGKKVIVKVQSWRSNTYGGYSKYYKKKVKVKK